MSTSESSLAVSSVSTTESSMTTSVSSVLAVSTTESSMATTSVSSMAVSVSTVSSVAVSMSSVLRSSDRQGGKGKHNQEQFHDVCIVRRTQIDYSEPVLGRYIYRSKRRLFSVSPTATTGR